MNIEARNLTIDNQVVVVVDAHDHQFDVRFAGNWQEKLRDDALNKLYADCQEMMVKRKVGKGASKGQ